MVVISKPTFSNLKDSTDKWYIYMVLFYTSIAYSGRLLFELFGLRPKDAVAYADISAWFGPGAYLAWWLTASSVLLKGAAEPTGPVIGSVQDGHWDVGADLLSSIYYVAAVATWSIVQALRREYAELDAGLIVLEAAADLGLMHVLTTNTKRSSKILAISLCVFSILVHYASPIHKVVDTSVDKSSAVPSFKLAVGVNLFVVAFSTLVDIYVTFPLKTKIRRSLTAFVLTALWLFSNELGTYVNIPHTGAGIISLDQLGPLGGALLVIVWSWKAEVKTGGEWIKRRIKSRRD